MMRMVLDPISGVHELQRLNNGAVTVLLTVTLPLAASTWHTLSLRCVNNYQTLFSVNGALIVTAVDYNWVGGVVGGE
jgi:hypothetical protein